MLNPDLNDTSKDNYKRIYNSLRQLNRNNDALFIPLSKFELNCLSIPMCARYEARSIADIDKAELDQQKNLVANIFKQYCAKPIRAIEFSEPRECNFALFRPWTFKNSDDNEISRPDDDIATVCFLTLSFFDNQRITIAYDAYFADTPNFTNSMLLNPFAIFNKPLNQEKTEIKPLYYFLNHLEVSQLMTKYGEKGFDLEMNMRRLATLLELNSENTLRFMRENAEAFGVFENAVIDINSANIPQVRASFDALIYEEMINTRLTHYSNDPFNPRKLAQQIETVHQKAKAQYQQILQQEQDEKDDQALIEKYRQDKVKYEMAQCLCEEFNERVAEMQKHLFYLQEKLYNEMLAITGEKMSIVMGRFDKVRNPMTLNEPMLKVLKMDGK